MSRANIAVIHPRLGSGGSESVTLWTAEALKRDADVTLVTGGPVDLNGLNAYYGTSIQSGDIRVCRAPAPLRLGNSAKFSALRGSFLHRYCRQIAPQFDLMINTYGPCDFGLPAVQCIADFGFTEYWRNTLHPELAQYRRWWYGDSPMRRAYLGVRNAIYRPDPNAWKLNLTLANSHWTARILEDKLEIASTVLYPPVTSSFPHMPWEQRENGFTCVGSVIPEKRMDTVIEILSRVRQHGHNLHLHILGGIEDSPFGKKIRSLAERNPDWVFLEGRVGGKRKEEMIASHRFGIHGRQNEPFGIAPAEMVKAGCIAFVPNSGGQTEIVDHPALTFADNCDAVKKIETVLASTTLQETLRSHLATQSLKFSERMFSDSMRRIVFNFLEEIVSRIPQTAEDRAHVIGPAG